MEKAFLIVGANAQVKPLIILARYAQLIARSV